MVRDISKPRWVCGICGACFEEDKAAAQRCEDAGEPEVLPAGELLLRYGEYGPRRGFFGGITSSSKYAVAWQWTGGGGTYNGYGDLDQIDQNRTP